MPVWVALAIYLHQHPGPMAGDVRFVSWLQSLPLDCVASIANDLAYSPVTIAIGLVSAGLLAARRRYDDALLVALAVAARLVNAIAKQIVERPRPDENDVRIIEHASGFSFPSGHTFGSSLLYGSLLIVLWRSDIPTKWKRSLATALLLLIISCGVARSYVGAHWPTDVGGAWLIAALWLALLARIAAFARRRIGPIDHFS